MAIVYHLTTGAHLQRYKGFFDCRCAAIKFFSRLLDECPIRLSQDQIEISHKLVQIDDLLCPSYRGLYQESPLREQSKFFKHLNEKLFKKNSNPIMK